MLGEPKRISFKQKPVNGLVSNIVTVLFGIAGLSGLFTDFYVFTVMAILQLSIRLYSWLKYESILED
ncbi:hypothetical protein [Caloramator sp. Dgby_cultured_2]|uniref:hypothetical protein n=1 Tax=Caloramator sp. Dgby_cultured_2 TaxID=3029174 RepID=UPI00237DDBAD|nr:hypothetical protein [Caloramator sp. Dgby_cultured_2]WDU82632.1 hypothetical protein PWK10_13845 [Caloramator sp. Dgby_cultured_2]